MVKKKSNFARNLLIGVFLFFLLAFVFFSFNQAIYITEPTIECYQETANIPVACGGIAGSYSRSPNVMGDGDWDTGNTLSSLDATWKADGTFDENVFKMKSGLGTVEYNIPAVCLYGDISQTSIIRYDNYMLRCYSEVGDMWIDIGAVALYKVEDAMLWKKYDYNINDTCYQESATMGNECGAVASGSYSGLSNDNYWNTYQNIVNSRIEYEKPEDVVGAIWKMKDGYNPSFPVFNGDAEMCAEFYEYCQADPDDFFMCFMLENECPNYVEYIEAIENTAPYVSDGISHNNLPSSCVDGRDSVVITIEKTGDVIGYYCENEDLSTSLIMETEANFLFYDEAMIWEIGEEVVAQSSSSSNRKNTYYTWDEEEVEEEVIIVEDSVEPDTTFFSSLSSATKKTGGFFMGIWDWFWGLF